MSIVVFASREISTSKFTLAFLLPGCTNGELRLVDGSNSNEGRVEICNNHAWGTICDDDWGTTEARVACRQLGLPSGGEQASVAYLEYRNGQSYEEALLCSSTAPAIKFTPERSEFGNNFELLTIPNYNTLRKIYYVAKEGGVQNAVGRQ